MSGEKIVNAFEAASHSASKIFEYNGRATRAEYFWFLYFWRFLILGLLFGLVKFFSPGEFQSHLAQIIFEYAGASLFFISWACAFSLSVRRLHDANRSGYWAVFVIVPLIGFIAEIVVGFLKPAYGRNDYGEDPRVQLMQ